VLEQLLPMFQDSVQAAVQAILLRHREIRIQQDIHRTLIEPLPMYTKLAARIDQPIHHQQFRMASLGMPRSITHTRRALP
jgi:hypothetical protein